MKITNVGKNYGTAAWFVERLPYAAQPAGFAAVDKLTLVCNQTYDATAAAFTLANNPVLKLGAFMGAWIWLVMYMREMSAVPVMSEHFGQRVEL